MHSARTSAGKRCLTAEELQKNMCSKKNVHVEILITATKITRAVSFITVFDHVQCHEVSGNQPAAHQKKV